MSRPFKSDSSRSNSFTNRKDVSGFTVSRFTSLSAHVPVHVHMETWNVFPWGHASIEAAYVISRTNPVFAGSD